VKPASLLRWYPRAWRERYGEEFQALIQDTMADGRPTWRLRLGVVWSGLRERGHQARRAGGTAVKRWAGPGGWWSLFVTGLVLASLPLAVAESARQAQGWQIAAVDGVLAAVALTGVVVLAGALTTLPALVRFLRTGGWPKIQRQVMRATGATVAACAVVVGLSVISAGRSPAQLNTSWAFAIVGLAAGLAMAVAVRLWATAAVTTARQLKLAPRVRAIHLVLGAVIRSMVTVMFVALTLWWSAAQSSAFLLVMALLNLVLGAVLVPSTVGRAVRRGRRLRTAAGGGR
jgi:hypothetical protein